MDTRDTSGPAFPVLHVYTDRDGEVSSRSDEGMSLRDYFAANALTGLLGVCMQDDHPGKSYVQHVAGLAYAMADAMLKERA